MALSLFYAPEALARAKGARKRHPPATRSAATTPKRTRKVTRPPEAQRVAAVPSPSQGDVIEISAGRAYLAAGSDDGLVVGQSVALRRAGRQVGPCQVVAVTDHHAVCEGAGLRPGDHAILGGEGAAKPPAVRPPPPSPQELERRAALVEATVVKPHDARTQGTSGGREVGVRVGVAHTSWVSSSADFSQERLLLALNGVYLFSGVRANLNATVQAWSDRPRTDRFPLRTTAQVFVREASLSYREPGSWLSLAVGRVFPRSVPGVPLFDGAQLGWRSPGGDLEVGAFGGLVPEPIQLRPGISRLAAGAYVSAHQANPESVLRWVQEEARVSFHTSPEYGQRLEAEARLRAGFGRAVDVGAWVRFGVLGAMAPAALDGARVDFNVRPVAGWRVSSGVRYTANTALDLPLVPGYVAGSRLLQADAAASWQPLPWFEPGLTAQLSTDLGTTLTRGWAGPDLGFPKLFGSVGGISAGYMKELGWLQGQNAYLQTLLRPASWFKSWVRLSYFDQNLGPSSVDALREVGLYASADFAVQRWLSIRLNGLGRLPVTADASNARPAGWVNVGVTGAF